MIRQYLIAFVPLFIAMDVVGVLPIYLGLVSGFPETHRRRIVIEAILTGGAIGLGFLLVGDLVLSLLGASVADFQVAGGILLLVLSIYDLVHPGTPLRHPDTHLSVVPLGTPLIVGPAVLATLLLLARTQGYGITLIAFAVNLGLVWAALRWAAMIERIIGEAGARAVAKVANLLLAAIAVTMIRTGLTDALGLQSGGTGG